MDPEEAARRLLQAVADGDDVTPWLSEDLHLRSDTADLIGRSDVTAWLAKRLEGAHRRFVPGHVAMKRNLVFAWWQVDGIDGTEAQGTWILSFDRDGHVVEWQEFKG